MLDDTAIGMVWVCFETRVNLQLDPLEEAEDKLYKPTENMGNSSPNFSRFLQFRSVPGSQIQIECPMLGPWGTIFSSGVNENEEIDDARSAALEGKTFQNAWILPQICIRIYRTDHPHIFHQLTGA